MTFLQVERSEVDLISFVSFAISNALLGLLAFPDSAPFDVSTSCVFVLHSCRGINYNSFMHNGQSCTSTGSSC